MQIATLASLARLEEVFAMTNSRAKVLAASINVPFYNVVSPAFSASVHHPDTHGQENVHWITIAPDSFAHIFSKKEPTDGAVSGEDDDFSAPSPSEAPASSGGIKQISQVNAPATPTKKAPSQDSGVKSADTSQASEIRMPQADYTSAAWPPQTPGPTFDPHVLAYLDYLTPTFKTFLKQLQCKPATIGKKTLEIEQACRSAKIESSCKPLDTAIASFLAFLKRRRSGPPYDPVSVSSALQGLRKFVSKV